jgi:oligoendopeptidase F
MDGWKTQDYKNLIDACAASCQYKPALFDKFVEAVLNHTAKTFQRHLKPYAEMVKREALSNVPAPKKKERMRTRELASEPVWK